MDVTLKRARQAKYYASEKGKATEARYEASEKARRRHKRHDKRRGEATRIWVAGKHLRLPSVEMKREVAELKAQRRACR